MTTIIIKLEIDGEPGDALHAAKHVLDGGSLQDEINAYDDALVEVQSATVHLGSVDDDGEDDTVVHDSSHDETPPGLPVARRAVR